MTQEREAPPFSTPNSARIRHTPGSSSKTPQLAQGSPSKRSTPIKPESPPSRTPGSARAGPVDTPEQSRRALAIAASEASRRLAPALFPPRSESAQSTTGEREEGGKSLRARKAVNYKEIPPEPFPPADRLHLVPRAEKTPGAEAKKKARPAATATSTDLTSLTADDAPPKRRSGPKSTSTDPKVLAANKVKRERYAAEKAAKAAAAAASGTDTAEQMAEGSASRAGSSSGGGGGEGRPELAQAGSSETSAAKGPKSAPAPRPRPTKSKSAASAATSRSVPPSDGPADTTSQLPVPGSEMQGSPSSFATARTSATIPAPSDPKGKRKASDSASAAPADGEEASRAFKRMRSNGLASPALGLESSIPSLPVLTPSSTAVSLPPDSSQPVPPSPLPRRQPPGRQGSSALPGRTVSQQLEVYSASALGYQPRHPLRSTSGTSEPSATTAPGTSLHVHSAGDEGRYKPIPNPMTLAFARASLLDPSSADHLPLDMQHYKLLEDMFTSDQARFAGTHQLVQDWAAEFLRIVATRQHVASGEEAMALRIIELEAGDADREERKAFTTHQAKQVSELSERVKAMEARAAKQQAEEKQRRDAEARRGTELADLRKEVEKAHKDRDEVRDAAKEVVTRLEEKQAELEEAREMSREYLKTRDDEIDKKEEVARERDALRARVQELEGTGARKR